VRKRLITYLSLIVLANSFCLSCFKPVDFDQINDFKINPVVESSLIYLDEPAASFLDNGEQVTTIQDYVQVEFFNNDFVVENLEKAEFVFEITNSINRNFHVKVDFFDSNSQRQHTFTIFVAASSNNVNVVSNYTEVFEDVSLEALKSTSVLVFTLNMLPGAAINQNTLGSISLKSKAVFYLNIDSSL
jgi:hypothetical protein